MGAGQIDGSLDARRDGDGQDAGAFALCPLQLHQNRRESLGHVVVNIPRETVALLEHGLPALFAANEIDETALVQRERRLTRHRLDDRDAPPLALGL